jgi:hypothetical protein
MAEIKQNVFNWSMENRFAIHFMHDREDVQMLGASASNVTLPSIIMGFTMQPTSIRPIYIPGDSMEFTEVSVQFLLQEGMENWQTVVDWIYRLRNPSEIDLTREVIDIGIDILNAKHKTILETTLVDAFPFSISDVPLNNQIDDVEPNRFDVQFKANGFNYNRII